MQGRRHEFGHYCVLSSVENRNTLIVPSAVNISVQRKSSLDEARCILERVYRRCRIVKECDTRALYERLRETSSRRLGVSEPYYRRVPRSKGGKENKERLEERVMN